MKALEIGCRRELFIDDYMIESLKGGASQKLHHPQNREIVMINDQPWEGNISGYHTVFKDGDIFRMYYRGGNADENRKGTHEQMVCYAESADGINWVRPDLGLVEFEGSKKNNIIWKGVAAHNFVPFKDTNPDCRPGEEYKAIGGDKKNGLHVFKSADGINWSLMHDEGVIFDGFFDSQNLAFWDTNTSKYRTYFRDFHDKCRDIKTAVSDDFIQWTTGEWLDYPGAPKEQLYTNQIEQYYRAPHIYIGFPSRFLQHRGNAVEGLVMTSRDGLSFNRWKEAFIRPGLNTHRWGNRSNYIWQKLTELPSGLPGGAPEISLYTIEHWYTDDWNAVRRFTIRLDGFVSVNSPYDGGEIITKPFVFDGNSLSVNYSTSLAGQMTVELLDEANNPIKGFSAEECDETYGDSVDKVISWNGTTDVSSLASRSVKLRFVLKDADLFSFKFENA